MSGFNQALFDRAWSLTIGPGGGQGSTYSSIAQPGSNPCPLRVVFDIDKNNFSSPNKSKIEIYNLNSVSRLNFQRGYQIQLQAGYVGMMSLIYAGDIPIGPKGAVTSRDPSGLKTTFECGDAEHQLVYSYFHKSYPQGTRLSRIVQDLVSALGVELGTIIGMTELVYNSGYVAAGKIKDILDDLMDNQELNWSVQNGYLQIIPDDAHLGESAIVLCNQVGPTTPGLTGLIGTPSQGDGFISFSALLNPHLLPGSLVQVISESINGYFKLRRANFRGDSYGALWQVDCEATAISNVQTYPQQNLNGNIVVVA